MAGGMVCNLASKKAVQLVVNLGKVLVVLKEEQKVAQMANWLDIFLVEKLVVPSDKWSAVAKEKY